MQRFYFSIDQLNRNKIRLRDDNYNHIVRALRYKVGDEIYAVNFGVDYLCKIEAITDDEVILDIVQTMKCNAEPNVNIHLYQALPKLDKLEFIVQKSVEVGVSQITPFESKNCVAKITSKLKVQDKKNRLQKISESASIQSGRGVIPNVKESLSFNEMMSTVDFKDSLNIVAYEDESETTLKSVLKKNLNCKHINIFVGSEGGFTKKEVEDLKEKGAVAVTLGKRILRCETAPIKLISNIIYELES